MPSAMLVPLDGSPFAETVLPPVGLVARATGAMVILLQIIPPVEVARPLVGPLAGPACGYTVWDADPARPHAPLERAAEYLAAWGVAVQKRVFTGEPAVALPAYIRDHPEIAQIALAVPGGPAPTPGILGAVAEQILTAVRRELLLVRPATMPAAPRASGGVVVALDGSPAAEWAVPVAQAVVDLARTPLILAGVAPPSVPAARAEAVALLRYLEEVAMREAGPGREIQAELLYGDPATALLQRCAQAPPLLIVLTAQGQRTDPRSRCGRVAAQIVAEARSPVLLLRPPAQAPPFAWAALAPATASAVPLAGVSRQ